MPRGERVAKGARGRGGGPQKVAAWAARRREALAYRLAGHTPTEIGKLMGISRQAAGRLVDKELRRIPKAEADELRKLELLRLEGYTREASTVLEARGFLAEDEDGGMLTVDGAEVRLKAIDRLVRVSERRAKVVGLDAPQRLELDDAPKLTGVPLPEATPLPVLCKVVKLLLPFADAAEKKLLDALLEDVGGVVA